MASTRAALESGGPIMPIPASAHPRAQETQPTAPCNGMIHPPEIREAQTAALSIRNTGMAVTDDVGNVGDIHPTNKQEVGRRLWLWALAKTYGQPDLVYCGPSYRSMAKRDAAVVLRFDHADGLMTRATASSTGARPNAKRACTWW